MRMTHGYECSFRHRNGSITTISAYGFETADAAANDARTTARNLGYVEPKWWEFQRWGETKLLRPTPTPK